MDGARRGETPPKCMARLLQMVGGALYYSFNSSDRYSGTPLFSSAPSFCAYSSSYSPFFWTICWLHIVTYNTKQCRLLDSHLVSGLRSLYDHDRSKQVPQSFWTRSSGKVRKDVHGAKIKYLPENEKGQLRTRDSGTTKTKRFQLKLRWRNPRL